MSSTSPTRFVRACRRQPVDRIPVWMMRQAGRYMQQYREVKERAGSFFDLCKNAELSAQATVDAATYLDTDAAIIFSDITLPAWAMGLELEFSPGPRFAKPVRNMDDARRLHELDPDRELGFVMQACQRARAALPETTSLIGFVGAPFTLAGYAIEGYPSRNWVELKRLLYGEPQVVQALVDRLVPAVAAHAEAQVRAGCDAIQLFDTLAGELAPAELHGVAFAAARRVIDALRPAGVPVIYFARGIGAHLEAAADLGADVLALDWTVSLSEARSRLGDERVALMGNLDPTVLFTSPSEIDRRARAILEQARDLPGFVFNLGHGVLPETPPEHARRLVQTVHAWSL